MIARAYYLLKPLIPRWAQIALRRGRARRLWQRNRHCWPILEEAGAPPAAWPGWPDGKRFALVLTHDVELGSGMSRCEQLADLEEERGFRSAFAFVPLRYRTPERLRRTLADRGFEVLVHDLYHDGKLYRDRQTFTQRRPAINEFLRSWQARGFASGSMHHNLPWIGELEIDYDISTFDVDPFEPQACGLSRIFPYWVQPPAGDGRGFVEMPYTLAQDFTLFILLGEQSNAIWRRKLDWIAEKGGMALIKTHPDYMAFHGDDKRMDRYPVGFYADFLDYVRARYGDEVWLAHPSEVARYWRGLAPAGTGGADAITWQNTFCATCRQAHRAGWLKHYPAPLTLAGTPPMSMERTLAGRQMDERR
ncbi:MAG: hypothetical protein LAP87_00845 [Acidobacteriia bacterium]|nr:hypothetical protein [Terriglobia bacterium]